MDNILALDQSTRVTGYAVFQDGNLIASGTFSVQDDILATRLVKIRNNVQKLIAIYDINKILLEDIQLQTQVNNVTTYKALAEVLGVLEELSKELKIPHEIILSNVWKAGLRLKGKGRADEKQKAQEYVLNTYSKKVSQDESDAICIGTYYINKNKSAF